VFLEKSVDFHASAEPKQAARLPCRKLAGANAFNCERFKRRPRKSTQVGAEAAGDVIGKLQCDLHAILSFLL
jgi:hypothetical protein